MRLADGQIKKVKQLLFSQEIESLGLEIFPRESILRDKSDILNGTDVEHRGRKIHRVAVLTKRLEEGVGGTVVALSWLLDNSYQGTGQHEEVKRLGFKSFVEVPCTGHFGAIGGYPVRVSHIGHGGVLCGCQYRY